MSEENQLTRQLKDVDVQHSAVICEPNDLTLLPLVLFQGYISQNAFWQSQKDKRKEWIWFVFSPKRLNKNRKVNIQSSSWLRPHPFDKAPPPPSPVLRWLTGQENLSAKIQTDAALSLFKCNKNVNSVSNTHARTSPSVWFLCVCDALWDLEAWLVAPAAPPTVLTAAPPAPSAAAPPSGSSPAETTNTTCRRWNYSDRIKCSKDKVEMTNG